MSDRRTPLVIPARPRDPGRDESGLTVVQRDTLARVAAGTRNADIARVLQVERHVVKNRVISLLRALGVESREEAVAVATARGLLPSMSPTDGGGQ